MEPQWHPNEVELDLYRTGEADAAVSDHVVGCDRCIERIDDVLRLAELLRPEMAEIDVPAEQDLLLRRMARQAAARGGRRRYWLVGVVAVAAAAAIVLAMWRGGINTEPHSTPHVAVSPAGPRDLNRDGQVDILDAFVLARTLDRGAATKPEWDVNGDDVVDRRDVDALAADIVLVPEEEK